MNDFVQLATFKAQPVLDPPKNKVAAKRAGNIEAICRVSFHVCSLSLQQRRSQKDLRGPEFDVCWQLCLSTAGTRLRGMVSAQLERTQCTEVARTWQLNDLLQMHEMQTAAIRKALASCKVVLCRWYPSAPKGTSTGASECCMLEPLRAGVSEL